jgi:clorobiocin biosynthesis protein CloN6
MAVREVLSTQNAGCAYNCGWCGGSREAFKRIYGKKRAMARKPRDEIRYEIETMSMLPGIDKYHFYSVGSYNEPRSGMNFFLDQVEECNFKSISYEQYHLTPDDVLARMAHANRRTSITLSPESHDPRIARLAGRGVYINEEMEAWIERALDLGIFQIDIWYFIGMPQQDAKSVADNVAYCEHLLRRFKGKRVNPMLCPMIPFLDPASTFFTHPEKHGYRSFFRTVEDHRRGMERASIINRTSYETTHLTRSDLVYVGYAAVRRLMEAKAEYGQLPSGIVEDYIGDVDDAVRFIREVHAADCVEDPRARAAALAALGEDILARNNRIFFSGVANQAFPVNREIGGRWFDELGWTVDELDRACLEPA